MVDGEVFATINTNGEETVRMPANPKKVGHTFDGWYWDEGTWQKPFTANSLLDAPLSSNMAVYAKWITNETLSGTEALFEGFEHVQENTYYLEVPSDTELLSLGNRVSVGSSATWTLSTDAFGNDTIASKTAALAQGDNLYYVLVVTSDGATELYTLEIRRRCSYEVVFDTAGGDPLESVTVEELTVLTPPTPTRDGYVFAGWDYDFSEPIRSSMTVTASWRTQPSQLVLQPNGGVISVGSVELSQGEPYTLPAPTRVGYRFLGWHLSGEEVPSEGIWDREGNFALTAEWEMIQYSISYDLQDGFFSDVCTVAYTVTSADILLPVPEKEGYVFVGWTGTGVSTPTGVVVISAGSTGDRSYTAHWRYDGYRINYHLNGGTNATANPDGYTAQTPTLVLAAPSRVGYVFDGWYTTASFAPASAIDRIAQGSTGDLDLYAKWSSVTYRIRFDANSLSASGSMPELDCVYGTPVTLPACGYTRNLFTFVCWCTTADGTGTRYAPGASVDALTNNSGSTVTLYAIWEGEGFTVTFEKGDGTGGTDSVTVAYDELMPAAIAPTAPLGYTFLGYFDRYGNQYYDGNMNPLMLWDKMQDGVLYAQWEIGSIYITLDKQGGTGGDSTALVTFNEPMASGLRAPTRAGYTFAGYYESPNGVGTCYYDADMNGATLWDKSGIATVYAHWTPLSYRVSFDANGGDGTNEPTDVSFGGAMPALTGAPTRVGYLFVGYFDAPTGGTKYYNADLSSAASYAVVGNATLYAQWRGVPYFVTFDTCGGTGEMADAEFEYSVSGRLPQSTLVREGYTFMGWTTVLGGTSAEYADGASVYNLTAVNGAHVIFYAVWEGNRYNVSLDGTQTTQHVPAEYTVRFDLNGAVGMTPADQLITNSAGLVYPAVPVREGYLFAGWYDNAACTGTPYNFSATVTGGVTLYAKWVQPSSYVSMMSVGSSTTVSLNGHAVRYYPFVSLTGGSVTVYTTGSMDTYGFIYDSSRSQLASNDDGGSNTNFSISFNATAGELYYVGVRAYGSGTAGSSALYISGSMTPVAGGTTSGTMEATRPIVVRPQLGAHFVIDELPVREGFAFAGWYDGEGGTGTQYTDALGNSVRVYDKTEDATFYPKWIVAPHTVTFDKQGGTGGSDSLPVATGEPMPLGVAPTRPGYLFLGYFDEREGGFKFYNADMSSAADYAYEGSVMLYAQWQAISYRVVFDANGGEGDMSDQIFTYDTAGYLNACGFTREGKFFIGWNTALDGTGRSFANASEVLNEATADGAVITLYAQWEIRRVNVTLGEEAARVFAISFDLNGAMGTAPVTQTASASNALSYPAIPTRSGYLFAGWYDNAACTGTPFDFSAEVTADTVLYAKWIQPSGYTSMLSVGGSVSVSFNGTTVQYYPFVPLVSGSITVYSNTSGDVYGLLFNASKSQLASNDDGNGDLDFRYSYTVTAGTLYYVGVRGLGSNSSGSGTVYISGTATPAAGGTVDDALLVEELIYGTSFTLPVPVKTGYTFLGWFDGVGGTGTQYTDAEGNGLFLFDRDSDCALYASWQASTYNVILDRGEGSGGSESVEATFDADMPEAAAPIRSGYAFVGYFDASGIQYYYADMTSARTFDVASGLTLYARYEVATFEILLDNRDGGELGSAEATFGSVLPVLSAPTRPGYIFLGYFDEAEGGNCYYAADMSTSLIWEREEGITLYAHWQASTYRVTFDPCGGSGEQSDVTATMGLPMPTITVAPAKVGYVFIGYFDAVTGGTKYYNADLSSAADYAIPDDATLFAQWEGIPYYVSFDANGGTGEMQTATYRYGTVGFLPENGFARLGYHFVGYSTAADGSGTAYAAGAAISDLFGTESGTLVLYAQWEANRVIGTLIGAGAGAIEVSFDLNGAAGIAPLTQTVTDAVALRYPAIPTRSGYVFAGWYDNAACTGTPFDFAAAICENLTLYARWASVDADVAPLLLGTTHNINIIGGSTRQYYAFVSPVNQTLTFTIGKQAWIYISTTKTSPQSSGYGTLSYTVTAGTLYYIGIESNYQNTGSAYVGATTLSVSGTHAPADGGLTAADSVVIGTAELVFGGSVNLPVPVRGGYTFLGWYDGVGGTGTQYTDAEGNGLFLFDKESDCRLYARWEAVTYTVIFDPCGGEGGSERADAIFDAAMPEATAPTREGYTFLGYFTEDGVRYYDAEMNGTLVYDLASDTVLYAHWEANEYTVTFDHCGGEGEDTVTVTFGGLMPPVISSARPGHRFLGYFTEPEGGECVYNALGMSELIWQGTEDTTLYAHWEIIAYSVTFDVCGGEGGSEATTVTYGAILPEIAAAPTRTGYTFLGYFTEGGTQYYGADLAPLLAWEEISDTVLYARWQANEYTVTLDSQGGEGEDTVTVTFDALMPTFATPTRVGYLFLGYFTEREGGECVYDAMMSSTLLWQSTSEITLYAQWRVKTLNVTLSDLTTERIYEVSFNLNGATGTAPETQTVTATAGLYYPTNPTRSGYLFAGWYANASCTGTPFDFTATVTANTVLYAKWIQPSGYTSMLSVGGTVSVSFSGTTVQYYPFVPLVSGSVTVYSAASGDIYGLLYSSTKSQLASNDDGGGNRDFRYSYTVTAGTLYYVGVRGYSSGSSGSGTVYITGTTRPTAGGVTGGATYVREPITFDTPFVLAVPAREGYTFLGWYDGERGTGTQYTDAEGNGVRLFDKGEDCTLYAKWEPVSYDIIYDLAGGTNHADNPESYHAESEEITLQDPTREGYSFVGWTTEGTTNPIKGLKIYAGSMGERSFTAHWVEYGLGAVTHNGITSISLNDELTAELFGAECIDTDGRYVPVTVTYIGDLTAGGTVSIVLRAESGGVTAEAVIEGVLVCGTPEIADDIWDGSIASSFAGGSGTQSDPYLIRTAEELAYLASRVNNGTTYSERYFRLEADLDLADLEWTSIGLGNGSLWEYDVGTTCYFGGTFDGNGHVISNLKQTGTPAYGRSGLFGVLNGATVRNLAVADAEINISHTGIQCISSILIAYANNSVVEGCAVMGGSLTAAHNGSNAGAFGTLCGSAVSSVVRNCYSTASMSATGASTAFNLYAGGLIGRVSGTSVSKCYYHGTISAVSSTKDAYVCGIVGLSTNADNSITDCFSLGSFSGRGSAAHADAIYKPWSSSSLTVSNCYHAATLSANSASCNSNYGTKVSASSFATESFLSGTLGFDTDTVWTFIDGCSTPVLAVFH